MHRKPGRLTPVAAAARAAVTRLRHAVAFVRPAVLDAAGLGLLASAAWAVAVPAGLAAAGLACLVLNWRLQGA